MRICPNCGERNPERARFCMTCATALERADLRREQRKIASMVFADLKGSTQIGERLDPEAVRSLLTRFYGVSREILERHGGTVEKFIGDAVMAVFGVPRAHADDAVRAVRAAAELRDTIERMNDGLVERYGVGIHARIGVNTGEVVAGDPVTGSSFVAGDAVNVAARLEQAAPPGEVLIGDETFRAAQDLLEAEPVEPLELKGKSERVPAYRLLTVRLGVADRASTTPLVGRARELAAVDAALDRVEEDGRPRLLLISGGSGIGKTRLVREALTRVAARSTTLGATVPPEDAGGWAVPVAQLVRAAAGLDADDAADEEEARRRLADLLTGTDRGSLVAASAARTTARDHAAPPDEVRWAVRSLLEEVARHRPVFVWLDDLGAWSPELLEVIAGFLAPDTGRLLVVATVAPEFEVEAGGWLATVGEACDRLPVPGLEDADAARLAEDLLGGPLAPPARAVLVDRAAGNPLFLIETVRMLRDRGALRDSEEGWTLPDDLADVPTSIRAVLTARLDLLSDGDRYVLAAAAVLGRDMLRDDLRTVLPDAFVAAVDETVARLDERQLLRPAGDRVRFPHEQLRDVAYASLTKELRAELHERAADLMEARDDVAAAAAHLEQTFNLRTELGAVTDHELRLGARGAGLFAQAGLVALDGRDLRAAEAHAGRAVRLASHPSVAAPGAAATLSFRLGRWDDVIALLDREAPDHPRAMHELGFALTRRSREEPEEMERGRRLLAAAAEAGDPDALAALAGTWKGIDDDRARTLYRAVLVADPSHPYALGNVLEFEIERAKGLEPAAEMGAAVEDAIARRRAQASAGQDVPWASYDLAKFQLLLGRSDAALVAYAEALRSSSAAYMVTSSLASLERLRTALPGLTGLAEAIALLRLGLVASHAEPATGLADLATPEASALGGPVVVFAGASDPASDAFVASIRPALAGALAGRGGTLISGGTTTGVSRLAAALAQGSSGTRAVGYLPRRTPDGATEDPAGYAELRRSDGEGFGAAEPLRYWSDILASGIDPDGVRVLAIGGGTLSGLEYRIALALGAHVGVVRGSGREAADLLRDPAWAGDRLVEVAPTAEDLARFLRATP